MTKTRLTFFALAIVLTGVSLAACAGFDVGDVVRVKTPHAIQRQTGLPSATTLNEAESEYRAWYADVQRSGTQWKNQIERGNQVRGLLNQLTLSALDQVGPTVGGIPVLGPALPVASGLLGLFFGIGRLRKEKEASFNKGMDRGQLRTSTPTSPAPTTPMDLNTQA